MCGIGGTLDADERRAEARVAGINLRQAHRGPDHEVVVRAGSFTLGNTRLAIQDPTPAGNQPFRSRDGRFVCVFNGELYNWVELIREFGLEPAARCDGAIIPELWAKLGSACLGHLRGMYAIAVVDTVDDLLTLARDPFGIKPLYFSTVSGELTFASEARALATVCGMDPPRVSLQSVASFLHLGSVPVGMSPFEGISTLAPNRMLTVDAAGRTEQRPILPGDRPLLGRAATDASEVAQALEESVDLHLRADVPTALLLSGGFDSAAVAAAARARGRDLTCLTVAGMGEGDEVPDASLSAARYAHAHKVVRADLGETGADEFFAAMQRPTVDGLNTFVVCRGVRERGYRVALSGLGADEALGGYAHYGALRWLRPLQMADRVPGAGRLVAVGVRVARGGASADKVSRLTAPGGPRSAWALDLLQREVHPAATVSALTGVDPSGAFGSPSGDGQGFAGLVEAELCHYLQPMLLADADAFSMCSSVELRVPFLDVAFFAAAIGAGSARSRPLGKRGLAAAFHDPFLAGVARRRKRGFALPMAHWLASGPLAPLRAGIEDPDAPVWGVVDRAALPGGALTVGGRNWSRQWALVVLDRWLRSLAS